MTDKIFIAADPGKTGAMSYIYPDGSTESFRFPLIGSEYDIGEMQNRFIAMSKTNCHLVIEDVKALQKPLDRGNWQLSRGKTILETLAICHNIPHTLVHAKTWQREMWQGIPERRGPSKNGKKGPILTKEMSLLAVKRVLPNADLRDPNRKTERAKAPQDGVVDSLLMAEYCRRKFK